MRNQDYWRYLTIVFCVGCFLAPEAMFAQKGTKPPIVAPRATPAAAAVATPANPSAAVAIIEQLNRQQFAALAPTAPVSYKGQRMMKNDFIALRLREYSAQAKIKNKSTVNLQALQAEMARKQQAEITARNAKAAAEWQQVQQAVGRVRQSPAYLALSTEANDLVNRYETASPAEKAQIKQRAQIVHDQLVQLEQSATGH